MAIISKGFDGEYVLTFERNRLHVPLNHVATIHNGGEVTITGGRAPHKESSTGRVYVTEDGSSREYFPGVVNTRWRKLVKRTKSPVRHNRVPRNGR